MSNVEPGILEETEIEKNIHFYANLWYWNKEILFSSAVDNTPYHVPMTWNEHIKYSFWTQHNNTIIPIILLTSFNSIYKVITNSKLPIGTNQTS